MFYDILISVSFLYNDTIKYLKNLIIKQKKLNSLFMGCAISYKFVTFDLKIKERRRYVINDHISDKNNGSKENWKIYS